MVVPCHLINERREQLGVRQGRRQHGVERQQLRRELEQQLELLKDGKINREDLAEMFGSMVSRLVPAAPKTNG